MRVALSVLLATAVGTAAFAQKKPLDHSVYDSWRSITGVNISRDGKWISYIYTPQEGDSMLEVRSSDGAITIQVPRASTARFTFDSKFLVATQVPPREETLKATRAKAKPEDMPKNNLAVVDLNLQKVNVTERIAQWQLAEEGSDWLLYRAEPPKPVTPAAGAARPATPPASVPATPVAPQGEKPAEKADDKPKKKADHRPGQEWVLRNLSTGAESKIADVTSSAWSKNGKFLALAFSDKTGEGDRVEIREVGASKTVEAVKGLGRYSRLTLSDNDRFLAFTTDKDDYAAKTPLNTLYVFDARNSKLQKVEAPKNDFGFLVNNNTNPSFSENGNRLIFGIGPKPVEEKEIPEDEKVAVDVWSWNDKILQPQQLLQATMERNRVYDVVADPASGKGVLIETPDRRVASIGDRGNGRWAVSSEDLAYAELMSWDGDYNDIFLIDTRNGEAFKVHEKSRGGTSLSENGKWLAIIDETRGEVYTLETGSRKLISHSKTIPTKLFEEDNDHPDFESSYGMAGWSKDADRIYLYDRYDLWEVDPEGSVKPRNLTNGRSSKTVYRVQGIDSDIRHIDTANLYLTVFNERTKDAGFARLQGRELDRLAYGPKQFVFGGKAKNAETTLWREGTAVDYPELRVGTLAFTNGKVLTDTNPQKKDYNWLTSELVTWRSGDGEELQGVIFKPENFDPTKKYPMIAYFYEKDSDLLHLFRNPAPSASTINIPLFVSQGYIVFNPDIPYKVGYPGESAISAIVSGVNAVVDRGYVDPKRIGIQGQSWGGYQVAYMVTETNMFAAAGAGAPVSNMFSAYGGIRYGSGLVRQFQYERQQSRIGGTPWNSFLRYVENSPLFHADKVETPLLMMHNDRDGAVPWTQGVEYFTALRRLNKPVWLLNYNNEDHNLVQRKNRKDLSIRLSQFFDHYLKDAPAPEWMVKGLPAVDKGRTMGTELVKGSEPKKG